MTHSPIKFIHLNHHIDHLEDIKELVLNRWMSHEDVQNTLYRYGLTTKFFSQHFGLRVIDYAFGVIRNEHELGDCPMMGVMLIFFNKKNISMEDLFIICVNFKNAMLKFMLGKDKLCMDTIHEISLLMDHNFTGVIREYMQLRHNTHNESFPSSSESKTFACNIFSLNREPLCTSALEYLQEIEIGSEVIDELGEIERETLSYFNLSSAIDEQAYGECITLFVNYTKVLNQLFEFEELANTLALLIDLLSNTPLNTMQEEHLELIAVYIKAIIDDLSLWRKAIFVHKNAEDIHYLDKTLFSSIAQLEICLSENENLVCDIEFF